MRRIEPGKKYKHFKGKIYLVLNIAEHTKTGEKMVVYKALDIKKSYLARRIGLF